MWLRIEKSNLPPKFLCNAVHKCKCYYRTYYCASFEQLKHIHKFITKFLTKYLDHKSTASKAALKFGSEAWVLKKREEQLLEASQIKFFRHLLGIKKLDKENNQYIRGKKRGHRR